MTRAHCLSLVALLALAAPARAQVGAEAWEVNGIRLEAAQVERLAEDLSARTLGAVERGVAELALTDAQRASLQEIYRSEALGVYRRIVADLENGALDDRAREERARALALEGQERSHARIASVLDERQLPLYSAWEARQVEAFKSKRWDRRRNRRARR
jgi:hypothetical protein